MIPLLPAHLSLYRTENQFFSTSHHYHSKCHVRWFFIDFCHRKRTDQTIAFWPTHTHRHRHICIHRNTQHNCETFPICKRDRHNRNDRNLSTCTFFTFTATPISAESESSIKAKRLEIGSDIDSRRKHSYAIACSLPRYTPPSINNSSDKAKTSDHLWSKHGGWLRLFGVYKQQEPIKLPIIVRQIIK